MAARSQRAGLTSAAAAAAAALVLALAAAASAPAATVVGQAATPLTDNEPCSDLEGVQAASGDGAPSYEVRSDGVITSFRHFAAPPSQEIGPQRIRLKVWERTSSPARFTIVAATGSELLTPGVLNEFPARAPVERGELLGITALSGGMYCAFGGVPGDRQLYEFTRDAPVGDSTTLTHEATGIRWNIEATVEPDSDGDAYGDETQDACPTEPMFHAAPCPPETIITFHPKFVHNPETRFRFRASEEGASFTCRMDGRRWKPCSSPILYRNLKTGRHTFSVYAKGASGVADPTPAEARFKVNRKPKKHR